MNKQVECWLNEHRQELVETLRESLRIPSVEGAPEAGAPLGRHVRKALDHALGVARSMGFEVKDLDGYAGCIDYGDGSQMLGVMCHLDVVPEGVGWSHPPYGAVVEDGVIYGRGALDDKGPAFASLYALAAVKEANIPLKRRVRIILGCNEESGWKCIDRYKQTEPEPDLAFSPDAEYPVVHSEKGICQASFKRAYTSSILVEAGTAANVVPGSATALVPLPVETVRFAAERFTRESGFPCEVKGAQGGAKITITGLAAHASMPESGRNALQAMLWLLSGLDLPAEDRNLAGLLHNALKMDTHGTSLSIDREDESGRLTLNPAIIKWNESGIEELAFDIRFPISMDPADLLAALKRGLPFLELSCHEVKEGHFIPAKSDLVAKLLDVYAIRTGQRLKPLAIGGGTYARAFKNAVAFGCEIPGKESPVHMPNECISVEDLMFNAHIIADAILALAAE